MNLYTIPFNEIEREKKYVLFKFQERGLPFAFLREKSQTRVNSGNKYKFGVMINKRRFHWFFLGRSICRDRDEALNIYSAILKYCDDHKLGQPFAYKES